jgi:hypothetical protein
LPLVCTDINVHKTTEIGLLTTYCRRVHWYWTLHQYWQRSSFGRASQPPAGFPGILLLCGPSQQRHGRDDDTIPRCGWVYPDRWTFCRRRIRIHGRVELFRLRGACYTV